MFVGMRYNFCSVVRFSTCYFSPLPTSHQLLLHHQKNSWSGKSAERPVESTGRLAIKSGPDHHPIGFVSVKKHPSLILKFQYFYIHICCLCTFQNRTKDFPFMKRVGAGFYKREYSDLGNTTLAVNGPGAFLRCINITIFLTGSNEVRRVSMC